MATLDVIRTMTIRAKTEGVDQARTAVTGLGEATDSSARRMLSQEAALARLERQYVAGAKQAQEFERIQRQLNIIMAQQPQLQEQVNTVLAAAAARLGQTVGATGKLVAGMSSVNDASRVMVTGMSSAGQAADKLSGSITVAGDSSEAASNKMIAAMSRLGKVSLDSSVATQKLTAGLTMAGREAVPIPPVLDRVSAGMSSVNDASLKMVAGMTAAGQAANKMTVSVAAAAEASLVASQKMIASMSAIGKTALDSSIATQKLTAGLSAAGQQAALPRALDRIATGMTEATNSSRLMVQGMSSFGTRAEETGKKTEQFASGTKAARYELLNLSRQLQDVGVGLTSGQAFFTVLIQQGSQIADAFQSASLAGRNLGTTILAMFTPIRVITGGLLGVGIAAVTAALQWGSGQRDIQTAISGMGRASGATLESINAIADATKSLTGLSGSEAREFASTLAATGKVGMDLLGPLTALGKDFARVFGIEVAAAAKKVADVFSGDLAQGALEVNSRLGSFDAAMVQNIRNLQAQGDRLGAQKALFDAMSQGIEESKLKLSTSAQFWTALGNTISGFWDKIGQAAANVTGIGLVEGFQDQMKRVEASIKALEAVRDRASGPGRVADTSGIQKAIELERQKLTELTAQWERYNVTIEEAKRRRDSFESSQVVEKSVPEIADVRDLQNTVMRLQALKTAIEDGRISMEGLTFTQAQLNEGLLRAKNALDDYKTAAQRAAEANDLMRRSILAITPAQKAQIEFEQSLNQFRKQNMTQAQALTLAEEVRANSLMQSGLAGSTALQDTGQKAALENTAVALRNLLEQARDGSVILESLGLTFGGLAGEIKRADDAIANFKTPFEQSVQSAQLAVKAAAAVTAGQKAQVAQQQAVNQAQNQNRSNTEAATLGQLAYAASITASGVAHKQAADSALLSSQQNVEAARLEIDSMGKTVGQQAVMRANLEALHQLQQRALSEGLTKDQIDQKELANLKAENAQLEELINQRQKLENLSRAVSSFADTFVQAMLDGKNAVEALAAALNNLGSSITSGAFKNFGDQISKSFGDIFSSLGSFAGPAGSAAGAGIGVGISLISKLFDLDGSKRKEAEEAAKKARDAMEQADKALLGVTESFREFTAVASGPVTSSIKDAQKQFASLKTSAKTALDAALVVVNTAGNTAAQMAAANASIANARQAVIDANVELAEFYERTIAAGRASLRGQEELTGIGQAVKDLNDKAKDLEEAMIAAGSSAEEAAKAVGEDLVEALDKLRDKTEKDLLRKINEATGKGFFNEAADLIKEVNEALALGVNPNTVASYAKAQGQAIVDREKLTGQAFKDFIAAFPQFAFYVHEYQEEVEAVAETIKRTAEEIADARLSLENRLFDALNDSSTLAGQLAALDRKAEQERAQEIEDGGDNILLLEQVQLAERTRLIQDFNDKIIEEEKRTAQERQDAINSAAKNIADYLNDLFAGPDAGLSPAARLSATQQVFESQLALAQTGNIEAQESITKFAEDYRKAAQDFFGSASGYQSVLGDITTSLLGLPAVAEQDDPVVAALLDVITAVSGTTTAVNGTTSAVGGTTSSVDSTKTQLSNDLNDSEAVLNIIKASNASIDAATAVSNTLATSANSLSTAANNLASTTNSWLNAINNLLDAINNLTSSSNSILSSIQSLNNTAASQLTLLNTQLEQTPATFNAGFAGTITANNKLVEGINKVALNTALIVANTGSIAVNTAAASSHGALSTGGTFQGIGAYAEGGWVTGGTPGRDSAMIMAMPGEYMIRKSVADMYGSQLSTLNATGNWPANDNFSSAIDRMGSMLASLLKQIATLQAAGNEKIDNNTMATVTQTSQINRAERFSKRKGKAA